MSSDVFRPRLPIDPFYDALPPWRVDNSEQLAEPHAILVLGHPTHADLAPIALSPHLPDCLLVIATHTPPPVPESPQCPVVILRLPAPLDIHDAGAVRLVALLDRAQRAAHAWHSSPHPQPRIQQFAELYPGGDFSIAEPPEFALPSTVEPPPSTSTSSLASYKKTAPPKGQYTFSALINFLPPTLPDKALLKHAILVTTLSAPFLAAQPPQSIFSSLSLTTPPRRRTRFTSLFAKQPPPSAYPPSSTPSTESLVPPRPRHPHLIHVLPIHRSSTAPVTLQRPPNAKSKLVQGIEQFLLSFAYPPSASASAPSLASLSSLSSPPSIPSTPSSANPTHAPARSSPLASPSPSIRAPKRSSTLILAPPNVAPNPPAIPFLVPAGLLGAEAGTRCIAELVLCGALDGVAAGEGEGGWPRAWIGGRGEVVVGGEEGEREGEREGAKKEKEKTKTKTKRRARRNEAGLPTPPESSSSSSDDDDDDDEGGSRSSHVSSTSTSTSSSPSPSPFGKMKMKMKMKSTEFLSLASPSPSPSPAPPKEKEKAQSEVHFWMGGGRGGGGLRGKVGMGMGMKERVSRIWGRVRTRTRRRDGEGEAQ